MTNACHLLTYAIIGQLIVFLSECNCLLNARNTIVAGRLDHNHRLLECNKPYKICDGCHVAGHYKHYVNRKRFIRHNTISLGDESSESDDYVVTTKKKKKSRKKKASTAKTVKAPKKNIKKKATSPTAKTAKTNVEKGKKQKRKGPKAKVSETVYFGSNSSDLCTVQQLTTIDETSILHTFLSIQNNATKIVGKKIIKEENCSSDNVDLEYMKRIHFTIRGNPLPLQRHRTYRNFVYNPSAQKQKQFYETVLTMLPAICFDRNHTWDDACNIIMLQGSTSQQHHIQHEPEMVKLNHSSGFVPNHKDKDVDCIEPFFTEDEFLQVKIIFHLKRPNNHFKSNKPGDGRIRPQYQSSRCVSTRVDVDNLAKFVLDSLNGILYVDDRQVVELHVLKLFDNEEECLGKTEVWITRIEE